MSDDDEKRWAEHLVREHARIQALFAAVAPPPTRVETIKEGWKALRPTWDRDQIDGRVILIHDLGVVEPILFELVRYGGQTVIEAEGVVVERL